MAYTTGTLGATANPARDFIVNVIHPYLIANGFTYVEEWTSTTDKTRVYKSAQANNSVMDWYLYLRSTVDTSTTVITYISEAWDATNKKVQKYVPATSVAGGGIPNAAANYTIADTVGVLPNSGSIGQMGNSAVQFALNTATGGHQYWMSVNSSRVILGSRVSTTDNGVYLGLADNMLPGSVPGSGPVLLETSMASVSFGNQYNPVYFSAGGYGGVTREPNQTIAAVANFATGISVTAGALLGVSLANVDGTYTNKGYAARVGVYSTRPATGVPTALRAALKDVVHAAYATTSVNGDTIVLDGKTYVKIAYTGGLFFVDTSV